jgi:Co/Zn/Cd efflux system component
MYIELCNLRPEFGICQHELSELVCTNRKKTQQNISLASKEHKPFTGVTDYTNVKLWYIYNHRYHSICHIEMDATRKSLPPVS